MFSRELSLIGQSFNRTWTLTVNETVKAARTGFRGYAEVIVGELFRSIKPTKQFELALNYVLQCNGNVLKRTACRVCLTNDTCGGIKMTLVALVMLFSIGLLAVDIALKVRTLTRG